MTATTLDELFPSNYLRAVDIKGDTTFTIREIKVELLKNRETQKDEPKVILYFEEAEKGIVLNKTNKNTLENMYGNVIADLIGKKVILHTPDVEGFGKVAPAIRIKAQKPVADRQALIDRFSRLYQEAVMLKVEDVTNYVIDPKMTDQEIIDLGKELKGKVEAAKAF